MRELDFVDFQNPYDLEDINIEDKELSITIDGKIVEMSWVGNIDFYLDSNESGSWVDYQNDIKLNVLTVDEEPVPEGFTFNESWVIEHIATHQHIYMVNNTGW